MKGLYDFVGKGNVFFSSKYFTTLNKKGDAYSYDSYMALVIIEDEILYRVIIDFGDDYPIRKNAYKWCDVYGKINYDPIRTPTELQAKILSIPPGFGIKIWNIFDALWFSVSNLLKLRGDRQISLRKHFHSYLSQYKALRLENFVGSSSSMCTKENYVFFIASLWPHQNCITGTNLFRKMFIETCIKNDLDFEGGFLITENNHPQFNEFKNFMFNRRYPLTEFIEKTKKSSLVFNTPAVHNCHGWKFGQFLAMHKAIISTPFQNNLPEDLVHGENIHFISDSSELDEAILKISSDDTYRKNLEAGAQKYYYKYASPITVIDQIFTKLKLISTDGE